MMKTILLFLLTLIHFLSGCSCPPKNPDGTKPPCRYVGPAISGTVGFQGVSVGITLWGDTTPKAPTVEIPVNVHAPLPILTK